MHAAFAIWKEGAVLQKRVQRARELTEQMQNQTSMQKEIREQLMNEHTDLTAELNAQTKEYKRNTQWLDNRIKRISLKSNCK